MSRDATTPWLDMQHAAYRESLAHQAAGTRIAGAGATLSSASAPYLEDFMLGSLNDTTDVTLPRVPARVSNR